MADLIKCPNCGENNLADLEFCQYCQSRLRPLTGNLKGENRPLTPGQAPTKKTTADLEPVLPQWLREARESSRQSSTEGSSQTAQPAPSTSTGGDLLAGLHSQSGDDDEEMPDWLANITGEKPKPKKSQPESSEVRWVELGNKKDFAQPEPEPESDIPSWLSGMASSTPPGEKDELTDWLRSADASQAAQQPSQPVSFDQPPSGETQDWLHSMVSDESAVFTDTAETSEEPFISSDTPDWLRGLEAPASSSGSSAAPAFSDTPDWLKAMDAEAAASKPSAPSASDTPDWLNAMGSETAPTDSDAPDWLKSMDAEAAASKPSAPPASDAPDWLKTMGAESVPDASDTPDWLKAMDAETAAPKPGVPSVSDTPDWLKSMGAENAPSQAGASDTPDWLKAMQAESSAAPLNVSDMPDWLPPTPDQGTAEGFDSAVFAETGLGDLGTASAGDEPDWLKSLEADTLATDQDWLKSFQSEEEKQLAPSEKTSQPPAPAGDDSGLDIPSWLKAAAPQSSIFGELPAAQEEPAAADAFETPDWLKTFQSAETPETQAAPAVSPSEPVSPVSRDESRPGVEADSLFTEMPDWLSITDDSIAPESVPAPITNVDAIAPGDLPSWVQAMRPVDTGLPQSVVSLSSDRSLETRGALAGLQGVLPVGPGLSPVRKPKAHSIKLQASEEQLQHAGLLEQILSAETEPVPIDSLLTVGTSRGLRWFLFVLVFAALSAVLFLRTQVFPSPVGFPVEAVSALKIVNESIPADGRVLVVFDYDPARAGEMEAIAVPMFDRMLRSRHPRLTFISTHEMGPILAERFISSGPLAEVGYQSGSQYLNLGYLPGGQMGIRAFVENPFSTVQYAVPQISSLPNFALPLAWTSPTLEGVSSFSQFSGLILITDNADSARAWIEQTTSARVVMPFVVVSSAQSAPVLQPYYASGQIGGLVSGLYSGILFEQNDEGRTNNVRAYWDAYSIGMLLAMALILGGGLINLALGLRDRASEEK